MVVQGMEVEAATALQADDSWPQVRAAAAEQAKEAAAHERAARKSHRAAQCTAVQAEQAATQAAGVSARGTQRPLRTARQAKSAAQVSTADGEVQSGVLLLRWNLTPHATPPMSAMQTF